MLREFRVSAGQPINGNTNFTNHLCSLRSEISAPLRETITYCLKGRSCKELIFRTQSHRAAEELLRHTSPKGVDMI